MESFPNLEDETFPSFLSNASLGSSGRSTLGNVTLGSNLGVPMAASTVAKSRAAADNRLTDVQASYLDEGPISLSSQASNCEREKFALSFKDDLENAGEFIAAHRFSDLLVKVNLDESDLTSSKVSATKVEALPSDISTGLLTFSHIGAKDSTVAKNVFAPVAIEEESLEGEALDNDGLSGSVASFLEHEKLLSIDSMDSDVTDDDFDVDNLHDDELKMYFNKLIPPGMQRGHVEGQEIPAANLPNNQTASSQLCVTEPTATSSARRNYLDNYKGEYSMPNVRLAATGMDSCPASDEDTEDELDAMRNQNRTRFLLPSSSRQLVGETHHPHFRPGLEGGSSEEESQSGAQFMDFRTSIEHRHSAEGQVIDSPLAGDGGDGSSGSEDDRNVGVATVSLTTSVQTTFGSTGHCNMEDRVGPVGTVENDSTCSISAFNQPNNEDEEQTLNAMDSFHAVDPEEHFDSMYLMAGGDDLKGSALPGMLLQDSQNSFHLSFVKDSKNLNDECKAGEYNMDFSALSLRGGPCGSSNNLPDSTAGKSGGSMDEKYLSGNENKSDIWNRPPDGVPVELQHDLSNANSVVYQNEEGKWVTDLAYYSSFSKDVDIPEDVAMQLQNEEFVDGGQAMEKIAEDQKIFEKEHQFIQEEQIEAVNSSSLLGDTSWKCPTGNHVPMRASQVSKEFEKGDQSYLRISLGEFFQQRSEALGCLGCGNDDVKRPSFGYIINSPEKREPFALIRPSEFGSRESSVHSDLVEISDADETMNPDDLEKTLEPTPAEQPEGRPIHLESVMENSGNSSGSSTNQTLSISTIASAIADASISSDPAQLAAMIMELSKKNRSRYRQADPNPGHPAPSEQTYIQDTMHITSSLSDLSALEMEKYLKKAEVSSSDSDASNSQSCLDILSLTTSLSNSQTLHKVEHLSPESKSKVLTPKQHQPSSAAVLEVKKLDVKKSAIPRPKSSNILTATAQPARRSLGAGQSLGSPSSVKSKQGQSVQVRSKSDCHLATPSENKNGPEHRLKGGTARSQMSEKSKPLKSHDSSDHSSTLKTSPGFRGGRSDTKRSPNRQQKKNGIEQTNSSIEDSRSLKSPIVSQAAPKETQAFQQCTVPAALGKYASPERNTAAAVEASHCSFRPSTSPLTQSSPSQTSLPSGYGELSPASSGGVGERSPVTGSLSPQSHCSSPSLSRLTYLSINEHTVMPTPDKHQKNNTMSLSTTIIRASPTPPMESIESNEPIQQNNSGIVSSSSHLQTSESTQKISDVGSRISSNGKKDYRHECGPGQTEPQQSLYTRIDSGYSSNLNIQHHTGGVTTLDSNQVRNISGAGSDFLGSKYGPSPITYKSEHLPYGMTPNYDSQGTLADVHTSLQGFVPGRPLISAQLPQQYMCTEGPVQASAFHLAPLAGPYSLSTMMSGATPQIGHAHLSGPTSLPSSFVATGHQYPINKPYGQPSMGTWSTRDLADLRTQVVVPNELKFPGACCVGIACQTSLSIFNPSERWQQVAISIVNLSIDGEKVDSMPFQWLIVKHKTIIGPKSTEEQKVLLIAPRAGLYQCTLSVSSWPASAESETVAQAEVFAKKVVLIAVAENPSIEVDVGKSGCLDFGDLAGGSMKALPLKVVNRTRATVPIRLVISATASAWNCFSFSKSPLALTSDNMLPSGANLPSISVINHVLHSGYGDNADSFLVWVHYNAPQRYKESSSGNLGPPDVFNARVDIEVDSPGPSHVIQSVGVRARSGTARVHAPKDLQTVFLRSALGQSSSQTLPLKNAGNIDVQLQLKSTRDDDCFTVKPEELLLRTGEEQSVVVTFTAEGSPMYRESLLTILVLPSGPQYEVVLKGEIVQENSRSGSSASVVVPHGDVPPILSNKQFMAWGGVTLGRAVQQKLVLRNNSPNTSQQLRLLIRGQDQDCFQLQSSFGPDERLTRSRELLIKPKEDVAIHLLFAPTRVACMLAKLEIKQSAVRPSQPGVKFTGCVEIPLSIHGRTLLALDRYTRMIPLSGYGGTSNVILEELRKRADGYVATLSGIQTGRVSKLCVCVRNTGSRAAFVRALPYSDLEKRLVMDSTVISLSPSQFILKERTQEVITVVMKASCREQALCQSHTALLATVCLFCGDEVSRQQYRKFLQNKPDAGKKVLSENSLLKSISFNEPFLGEEVVEEAFDLPQRPNEAQIFFANMSKVILSLFGTVDTSDSGESDNIDFVRPTQYHVTDSDSGLGTSERHFSNISLDVLPVKGPPLCVSEPIVKTTESSGKSSWCIQPEQLVLTAPTVSCAADTKHVRLQNRSDRELSFELSWPAHCLTITPQHGVVDPQSHLQILISPNPSLATKSSLLPWSGQIYVQCDNQQKFIKVQIRQDLAMDISATGPSSERSLCPLPPQADTPLGSKVQSSTSMSQVEIKNRTLLFPSTCSGESSECLLDVENHGEEVRWYLSSFAPPYVKDVDGSGDVYRATYTAFRCEKMSGMLGVKDKMQVPFTFLPRDGGDYAQFWDLECHPVSKPQQKSRIRFQLCGTGIRMGKGVSQKEDCTLVRTEVNVKNRKRVESVGSKNSMEPSRRGLYAPQSLYTFPQTRISDVSTLKVNFRNNSANTHELRFISPTEPFYIKHSKYSLRTQHYINLPVQFKPTVVGQFSGSLLAQTDTGVKVTIDLSGEALP